MSGAEVLALAACGAGAAALLDLVAALPSGGARRPRSRRRRRSGHRKPAARWSLRRDADEVAERLLDAAGRPQGLTADQLRLRERLAAVVVAAWSSVLLLPMGAGLAAAVAVPAGLVGRRVPRLLLARAARARADDLHDAAADTLDLLAAGAACGLPLGDLLRLAGDWLDGPLARGVAQAGEDLARGAAPERVLARLVRHHPVEEVSALVAILERARLNGVPSAPALRALAVGTRAQAARRAGDRAAKAAPRIQLVAALLLVPAALCILAAAMVGRGIG